MTLTDAMLFALDIGPPSDRILAVDSRRAEGGTSQCLVDVEELIDNIDFPFGAPLPWIRTAILASRDRVGTRRLAELMWCWAGLRQIAAKGVQILDWFIVNGDDRELPPSA